VFAQITNLCTFSKVLEKLALARLQPHVFSSGNFSRFQSAYRAGHSTETALLKVTNDIERAAGEGKCTVLLSLDISAAFDAVDHSILCQRAEADFGLCDAALDWLRSFVVDRSQYVAVGTERSATTRCETGIGQGTVLGPLCFAMYVSPIGDVIDAHAVQYHQYAHDLQLYYSLRSGDFNDLSSVVQCTKDVSRWFLENGLLLNATKTEAVVFGTRQRLQSINRTNGISAVDATVQFADAVKLLGVTLDSTLSFDRHITDVVRNCHYHLRAFRHIRPRLTTEAAKSVASSIIGSRLDYCNSLLCGTTERNFDRLQITQNLLARVVCQAPRTASVSVTELIRALHWLPIRQRVQYKTALIAYKTQRTAVPSYLADLLKSYQPARSLRSSSLLLLCQPPCSTNFERRAFSISAPVIWNSLSLNTRAADSVNICKNRLKTELFAIAYSE